MIGARILLDSVSPWGIRLTTVEATFHRYVLAEANTHRAFSRNSASSRAIPVEKMLDRFENDWAFPSLLPAEQPGMQGGSELWGTDRDDAVDLLRNIHDITGALVRDYLATHPDKSKRLHKSVINRVMEWGQYHTAIITATDWTNFFNLRCSPQAQPEFRLAAEAIRDALDQSAPRLITSGEWHTPLIQTDEMDWDIEYRCKVSAARCARVSYLTHDGKREPDKDVELFEKLTSSGHWSPLEHIATPKKRAAFSFDEPVLGNFRGWHQMRHRYDLLREQ